MAAGNTAGFADRRAAIPQNARMGILPADGQGFIYLEILTGLDAAAAENALVGIVAVKRVGVVDFPGFGLERYALVLHPQQSRGVVYRAVAIVVVAYGA